MNMETINECSGQIVDAGIRVHYDGTTIDNGYRLDLLVNDLVIVEVKAAVKLAPIHKAVLLTYLRLSNHALG